MCMSIVVYSRVQRGARIRNSRKPGALAVANETWKGVHIAISAARCTNAFVNFSGPHMCRKEAPGTVLSSQPSQLPWRTAASQLAVIKTFQNFKGVAEILLVNTRARFVSTFHFTASPSSIYFNVLPSPFLVCAPLTPRRSISPLSGNGNR